MMTWYQILSFFITNGLRIFLGLYLVAVLLQLSGNMKKATALSSCAAVCITALSCFSIRPFFSLGAEIIILVLIAYYLFAAKLRMCLFLAFFYEIAVALWEFVISAGLGVLFQYESLLDIKAPEYIVAVWIVRLLMLGIAFLTAKEPDGKNRQSSRIISIVAVCCWMP